MERESITDCTTKRTIHFWTPCVIFFFHFSGKGNFVYLPASELTYSLMRYSFQMIDTIPCVPSWAIYPILNVCSSVHHTVACVILHWGRPEHLSWYTVWKIPTNPCGRTSFGRSVCTVNDTINAVLQDCEGISNMNSLLSGMYTMAMFEPDWTSWHQDISYTQGR